MSSKTVEKLIHKKVQKVFFNTTIEPETLERIKKLSKRHGVTQGEIVRAGIDYLWGKGN
jgi:predicted DNA-binding protein